MSEFASQLPQLDTIASRLRTCARRASAFRWPEWCGIALQVRMDAEAPAVSQEVYVDLHTAWGRVGIAISPAQWPSLASAARVQDQMQRSALALILIQHIFKSYDGFLKAVELKFEVPADSSFKNILFRFEKVNARFLFACDDMLMRVEQELARVVSQRSISDTSLRIQSKIFFTAPKISLCLLKKLAQGDVVLLPSYRVDTAMTFPALCDWGKTRRGRVRMKVILQEKAMTILEKPLIESFDENFDSSLSIPHLEHSDSPGDLASLELQDLHDELKDIQLNINFFLPGPTSSISEIAALAKDDTLELPIQIDEARVRIVIAGQCVGTGELIAVGRRLGVRILHIDIIRRESNKP